jgi:hypothetical protein
MLTRPINSHPKFTPLVNKPYIVVRNRYLFALLQLFKTLDERCFLTSTNITHQCIYTFKIQWRLVPSPVEGSI